MERNRWRKIVASQLPPLLLLLLMLNCNFRATRTSYDTKASEKGAFSLARAHIHTRGRKQAAAAAARFASRLRLLLWQQLARLTLLRVLLVRLSEAVARERKCARDARISARLLRFSLIHISFHVFTQSKSSGGGSCSCRLALIISSFHSARAFSSSFIRRSFCTNASLLLIIVRATTATTTTVNLVDSGGGRRADAFAAPIAQ